MARLTCAKCGHEWVRNTKMSRGQLIRCPSCRMVLGKMRKPKNPMTTRKYVIPRGVNEWRN